MLRASLGASKYHNGLVAVNVTPTFHRPQIVFFETLHRMISVAAVAHVFVQTDALVDGWGKTNTRHSTKTVRHNPHDNKTRKIEGTNHLISDEKQALRGLRLFTTLAKEQQRRPCWPKT